MADSENLPKCFGPYLRYAISKGFGSVVGFATDDRPLLLLVEFWKAGSARDFALELQKVRKKAHTEVEFSPEEEGFRYVTLIAERSAVRPSDQDDDTVAAWISSWDTQASRVELSFPLIPTLSLSITERTASHRWEEGQIAPGKLLIGVLDDGCPFAAARFLKSLNPASTRVRAIWDQNPDRKPIKIVKQGVDYYFGEQLPDFNFSLEYRRDSVGQQIGLDEWIRRHTIAPTNTINEDATYADACFKRLAPSISHGAHVMDVIAGPIPISSRIGPTKPGTDHRDPPSWAEADPAHDPACGADVVFVQFPESGIRDATGVWLKAYVVRGIHYILSHAKPHHTEDVIVNLSYGPTTGPHDGTADLEMALAELVDFYDGNHGRPRLHIFLAAGNSYLLDGHVHFVSQTSEPNSIEWTWRLPPDNTAECFAEIWMERGSASYVTVTLTPPGGGPPRVINSITHGPDVQPINTMWRLDVGPTVVPPKPPIVAAEPHGDYRIKVEDIPFGAHVHAYVARTDPNMNVATGAKLSRFVDPNWVQTRSAEASCEYENGEFDRSGSLISRFGTLNGIATDKHRRIHVAGGDMLMDGRKAPYASAGPARRYPYAHRIGPDYAMFCDESYALEGVRAGGNRSGTTFRLIGTSAAAPQLARQSAKLTIGKNLPPPTHPTYSTSEKEQRGAGDLEPP